MLAHIKEIINKISNYPRAVGAFNVYNLETAKAAVKGAVAAGCPAVIQTTETAIKYAGAKNLFNLVKSVIEDESGIIPMAIHLDHGKDLQIIEQCLRLGYSSVHCDASAFPFEDNIKITMEAAEIAHKAGAWVQGELGNILGKEGLIKIGRGDDINKYFTDPDKTKDFAEKTGVDVLAVSLGNFHGYFVGQENLDFERLQNIQEKVKIPLVLHGGSGISAEQIRKAIGLGVKIINVDTELRLSFAKSLRQSFLVEKDAVDLREHLKCAMSAMAGVVKEKCILFYKINPLSLP